MQPASWSDLNRFPALKKRLALWVAAVTDDLRDQANRGVGGSSPPSPPLKNVRFLEGFRRFWFFAQDEQSARLRKLALHSRVPAADLHHENAPVKMNGS